MFFPSWAIISCNTYTNKREFLSGRNKEPPSRQRGNHTGNLQNSCRFQAGIPNPKPTSINRMQPPQKTRKHPEPGRDALKKRCEPENRPHRKQKKVLVGCFCLTQIQKHLSSIQDVFPNVTVPRAESPPDRQIPPGIPAPGILGRKLFSVLCLPEPYKGTNFSIGF